jgi:hypothetical protein
LIALKKYQPEGALRLKSIVPEGLWILAIGDKTGPKGHYVQKQPTQMATAFKKDWSEGQLRLNMTGPKGQYD